MPLATIVVQTEDSLSESFRIAWEGLTGYLPDLLIGLLVLIVFIAVGRIVGGFVGRGLGRFGSLGGYQVFFRLLISFGFALLGIIVTLHVLDLTALATGLLATGGFVAIAVGFAFRAIGENLFAGFLLAASRPFEVGDLIESEGHRGIVETIELKHVHIRTEDGCDIFIPSAAVYTHPLKNFTRDGLRRFSFSIGIDYADDSVDAGRVLLETVGATEGVLKRPAPSVLISSFTAQYVEFTVLAWVSVSDPVDGIGPVKTRTMNGARDALKSSGFTFSSEVSTAVELSGHLSSEEPS